MQEEKRCPQLAQSNRGEIILGKDQSVKTEVKVSFKTAVFEFNS